jgi:hypothetical protein
MAQIATTGGGGVATTGGGSLASPGSGTLVAGDVRIGDIRSYSAEVQSGADQLQSFLSGIGPTGLALVTEFEHLAHHMREIANELIGNASKTGSDGWDSATVDAARQQAGRATAVAVQAETDAKDLRDFLETRRARQRELARQLAESAQNTIDTVNDGHARLERAVKENPVQPAPRTDQYANR